MKVSENRKRYLWYGIFLGFLGALLIGFIIFILRHKPHIEWTVEYWMFIMSMFAAFFSGLNVLVFYRLTIAVEAQNTKRQEAALRYDAIKHQLERQQEVFGKVETLCEQVISQQLVQELREDTDIPMAAQTVRMIDNKFSVIQILSNCTQLFPTVDQECVADLQVVYRAWKHLQIDELKWALNANNPESSKNYVNDLKNFWERNTTKIYVYLTLIVAQMRYDMQVVLSESLGQQKPTQPDFVDEKAAVAGIREMPKLLETKLKENIAIPLFGWDTDSLMSENL